jgi:peptide subunit release factor 1 (eRF1)
MTLGKAKKDSLQKDLDKIDKFCSRNLNSHNHLGLAVFSCADKDFWEVFNLPTSPRNRVIFDRNAYIRPLSAILGEYQKICVFTIDRKEAKWYEVFMGEIKLLNSLTGDVPSRVKEGGWEGYESKRIERHISSQLHEFFKKTSQETFNLMKKNKFDWLFVGCKNEHYTTLEPLFHPYLKERLKGRLKIKPGDPQNKILKQAIDLRRSLNRHEKKELVLRFSSEINKNGLAVNGLVNTLKKLNHGEVNMLLITRHFAKPGKICPSCKFLYVDESECPSCQRKTSDLLDVVDEALEAAMDQRCRVMHINPPSELSKYGDIGAFLRYKVR